MDLAVQDAPLVRQLVLLLLELGDQLPQFGVGQACEIGKRFHGDLSLGDERLQQ